MFCNKKETKDKLREELMQKFLEFGSDSQQFTKNDIILLQVSSENKTSYLKRTSCLRNIITYGLFEREQTAKQKEKYNIKPKDYFICILHIFIYILLSIFCCACSLIMIVSYRNSFANWELTVQYFRQNIILFENGIFVYWKERKGWAKLDYLIWWVYQNFFFKQSLDFKNEDFSELYCFGHTIFITPAVMEVLKKK
eukprot:snap_masked-scaffold_17-processed-gene-6.25-mRNA-1 protein AED:1.00 eAED:1.00 QI:0/0/0/0/1/1/2/0/196